MRKVSNYPIDGVFNGGWSAKLTVARIILRTMKTTSTNILKSWKEKIVSFLRDPLFLSRWVSPYHPQRETNRISVAAHVGGYRRRLYPHESEIRMFVEDMHSGIMPFTRLHRGQSQFDVHLDPNRDGLEALIAEALHGDRYDLTDTLCDFIREAAQSLFFYGRIAYEIVYECDVDGRVLKFSFASINPLSITRIFDRYLQLIPWWVARRSHVKAGIRRIPKDKMLYIELPQELGGRKGIEKILKRLSALGKELIPDFHMSAMKENRNIGFDLNKYTKEKYLEKARITRHLGWNQRKIPDNEILEYYSLYRRLKFALSQAIVREQLLEAINQAINGPLLNLGTKILMEGIPNSKQIAAEFQVLKAGNLEFQELFKRTTIE